MLQPGIRVGSRGFPKDKSGEKLAEAGEDRFEFRTNDADTLFVGMNFYSYETAARGIVK